MRVSMLHLDVNLAEESYRSLTLTLGAIADHAFYHAWTFPPSHFFEFNFSRSFANIYGENVWHYYVFQGFPLLLTTLLPYALVGLWQALSSDGLRPGLRPTFQLAIVAIFLPFILSFVSHKEVRFIYPILPVLHVLAAGPFASHYRGIVNAVFSSYSGSVISTSSDIHFPLLKTLLHRYSLP